MNLRFPLVLALLVAALSASAAVIDFEDLANNGPGDQTLYGTPVVSRGFAFASSSGSTASFSAWTPAATTGDYTGSVAIADRYNGDTITMTAVGGAAFTLNSMQLANLFRASANAGQGSTLTFTGTKAGGGTVTSAFTIATGDALQTATFSGFTNLVSVSWQQLSPYHQFDNIVVNAVPEPSALLALGLPVLAFLRRRGKG